MNIQAVSDKIGIWSIDVGCAIISFAAYGSPFTALYVQGRSFRQIGDGNFEGTEINFLPCHIKSDKQKSDKCLVILFKVSSDLQHFFR